VKRLLLVALAGLVFFGLPAFIRLYTDWLWFVETGYTAVFTTNLLTRVLLGAAGFLVAAGWLYANFRIALGSLRLAAPIVWSGQEGVRIELPGRAQLLRIALGVSILVAIPAALVAANHWLVWLTFRNAVAFNAPDPVLGRDASFYIFTLPWLEFLQGSAIALVVLAAIGSGAIYALGGGLGMAPVGGLVISRQAQRHLCLLAAAFLLLQGVGAWLSIPEALTSGSGLIQGATYADVAARFPAARILTATAAVAAILAALAATRGLTLLLVGVVLYLVVSFAGNGYAAAIQRFVVAPNEQARETPYMLHNIAATRRAFALDAVEEQELSGDATLDRSDIARNAATLRNVRLWDHQPLLDTFGQLQEIRPYYDFVSVDNDRYVINGEYRQVMLSGRELESTTIPNRTWINEHLTFTHGYGLTLGPVNQVTQEGLPVLYIKDLPPVATADLQVTQPSLYFAERSNDYVFVGTNALEFDYPKGDDNVTTAYAGTGGVPVDSLFKKLAFSIRFRAQQVLFSSDINTNSRVLFYRRIGERVRRIAPFLWYDGDPYLVVHEGRLFWMQDAYTWSTEYPYSTASDNGINYIRNAVKVVIDAYHGTTTFYMSDPADPLVQTYARIFPSLFRPLGDMPAGLREHIRYPETLFGMQTRVYATYHMDNPTVFYNREDQWEVPVINDRDGQPNPMEPYYTIMKLPGETSAEFIQMIPMTPRRKDNLAAWMIARSDGEHYGRLFVYRFPKQKVIFGPRQVVARINQDQVIAPQITLWNQQGSQVIQGTLLVIPIEESLLYIRPLYLRGEGGRIPELKRVIVAYQSNIVMETSLEAALDRLFGSGTGESIRLPTDAPPPAPIAAAPQEGEAQAAAPAALRGLSDLAGEARSHYERALAAQREGNWALYGEEIKKLGDVLQKMRAR
jgi:uncharacterized membrane protein (UPF0182 family)